MPRVLIGSIAEMRVSISLAALLVKVTARTPFGLTFPVWMSQAMRVVRTRVLPEPAPARISADWSGRVTAASCSGLRFSRRLVMRAFANGRFYRREANAKGKPRIQTDIRGFNGPRSALLRADFVLVLPETGVLLERARDELGVFPRFEIGQPHVVDALVPGLRRDDLGRIAGVAQIPVKIQRPLQARGGGELPFAAALRHALARPGLGFRRPFRQLIGKHHGNRLRPP